VTAIKNIYGGSAGFFKAAIDIYMHESRILYVLFYNPISTLGKLLKSNV
jgi:hypothetical protein